MMLPYKNVTNRVIFNQVSDAAAGDALLEINWTSSLDNFNFVPNYAIIRQIIFTTNQANTKLYKIESSLNRGESVGIVSGSGSVIEPQQVVKLSNPPDTVSFRLIQYNYYKGGTLPIAADAAINNDASIMLSIDFVEI